MVWAERPVCHPAVFPDDLTNPVDILRQALSMEEQVVINYTERINQANELGGVDGRWIEIFLEEQIMHSRKDTDHIKQMI